MNAADLDLCKELYEPVTEYESIYEVSNLGNVRSLGGRRGSSPRLLRQSTDTRGYKRVDLCINGKRSTRQVHRLVAEHHIPNPNGLPHVNHIDGNPSNNVFTNLEWCDHQGNMNHAWTTGLMNNRGEHHGMHKLKEFQAQAIKAHQDRTDACAQALAADYGISDTAIYDIWAGRTWSHV